MKRMCPKCKKQLFEIIEAKNEEANYLISQCICSACQKMMFYAKPVNYNEFLDYFDHPVLLISHERRIMYANEKFRVQMSKQHSC